MKRDPRCAQQPLRNWSACTRPPILSLSGTPR